MSGGSGGGSQQSAQTVTSNTPWTGQQPYLKDIYQQAQDAQKQVSTVPAYTGDFVNPASQSQKDTNALGFSTGQNVFNLGGGVTAQGVDVLNKVLGLNVAQKVGDAGTPLTGANQIYLNPNANPNLMPALELGIKNNAKLAREELFPQISQAAWNNGAYGGTSHGTALARTADQVIDSSAAQTANALSNIWNTAYTTERGIQAGQESQLAGQQMDWNKLLASLGPSLLQQGISTQGGGLQTMQAAGAQDQAWGQDQIQNILSRLNYQYAEPYQNLSAYAGLIGGAIPGGGISTQYTPSTSMFGNALGGALGGASLGYGIGSTMGYGGVGAGAGAGLGALAGLFM